MNLGSLAFYYEKQHNLKKKIQSTLNVSACLTNYYIIVVVFLMLTIVPTFTAMFVDFDAELPFITVFVMAISDWFKGFWWLLFIVHISASLTF